MEPPPEVVVLTYRLCAAPRVGGPTGPAGYVTAYYKRGRERSSAFWVFERTVCVCVCVCTRLVAGTMNESLGLSSGCMYHS